MNFKVSAFFMFAVLTGTVFHVWPVRNWFDFVCASFYSLLVTAITILADQGINKLFDFLEGKNVKFTKNPYFTIIEKIALLQRWIIVHSIIYYELNGSVVTDNHFDANSRQLVKLMVEYPEETKKTRWYYCMKDFDGSTGFDLYRRLNQCDKIKLMADARRVLKYF